MIRNGTQHGYLTTLSVTETVASYKFISLSRVVSTRPGARTAILAIGVRIDAAEGNIRDLER